MYKTGGDVLEDDGNAENREKRRDNRGKGRGASRYSGVIVRDPGIRKYCLLYSVF